MMKASRLLLTVISLSAFKVSTAQQKDNAALLHPVKLEDVVIKDSFWSPKYRVWNTVTVDDVFDKLEGNYVPDRQDIIEEKAKMGRTRNALLNFDLVAQGKKNTNTHDGPPWYDGLLYETIRGAADLLIQHPNKAIEKKIDGYIDRIAAAQAVDPDGYINTYTTLTRPDKRWGTNGGDDKWQHDIYNAGMLTEAAVHYYDATHKTKLLTVAVKMANFMYKEMGPAPKKNVVPGHAGPEEAMIKMYRLFKKDPGLKKQIKAPVNEQQYFDLAKFWIEQRGHYGEPGSSYARNSDSSYNQDHIPVLEQKTIEGHAVRATLLATGVTAMAIEKGDDRYINTANHYWDNMIGQRMFITGGEGAFADGERFGANYFMPESAYLETCASIGAGFFSEQMNELKADGKYMDEFERVAYNNLLSGVSLSGEHYHYENPLITKGHPRWAWHSCPCCPPMILKMAGALPQYIYASSGNGIYVNLFIGSEAKIPFKNNNVSIKQTTQYPWKGAVKLEINPAQAGNFTVHVRIPGWAQGKENPFDLYSSAVKEKPALSVNGKEEAIQINSGYAAITRNWKKGDVIELKLSVEPRVITPSDSIQTVKGKIALAAGPVIYGLETGDNPGLENYTVQQNVSLSTVWQPQILNGINVIKGTAADNGETKEFTAIPFYSIGNRDANSSYKVWLPAKGQ